MDWENDASASGPKRPRFSSGQVESLLFDLEDKEQTQSMNNPDELK